MQTKPPPASPAPATVVQAVAGALAYSHARWTAGTHATQQDADNNLTPLRHYEASYAAPAALAHAAAGVWRADVAAIPASATVLLQLEVAGGVDFIVLRPNGAVPPSATRWAYIQPAGD